MSKTLKGAGRNIVAGGGFSLLWDPATKTTGLIVQTGDTQAKGASGITGAVRSIASVSAGTPVFTVHIDSFSSGYTMWIGLANASAVTPYASGVYAGTSANYMGLYLTDGTIYRPDGGGGNAPLAAQPSLVSVTNDLVHIKPDMTARTCDIWINGGTPYTVDHIPTGDLYLVVGFDNDNNNQASITGIV